MPHQHCTGTTPRPAAAVALAAVVVASPAAVVAVAAARLRRTLVQRLGVPAQAATPLHQQVDRAAMVALTLEPLVRLLPRPASAPAVHPMSLQGGLVTLGRACRASSDRDLQRGLVTTRMMVARYTLHTSCSRVSNRAPGMRVSQRRSARQWRWDGRHHSAPQVARHTPTPAVRADPLLL